MASSRLRAPQTPCHTCLWNSSAHIRLGTGKGLLRHACQGNVPRASFNKFERLQHAVLCGDSGGQDPSLPSQSFLWGQQTPEGLDLPLCRAGGVIQRRGQLSGGDSRGHTSGKDSTEASHSVSLSFLIYFQRNERTFLSHFQGIPPPPSFGNHFPDLGNSAGPQFLGLERALESPGRLNKT